MLFQPNASNTDGIHQIKTFKNSTQVVVLHWILGKHGIIFHNQPQTTTLVAVEIEIYSMLFQAKASNTDGIY